MKKFTSLILSVIFLINIAGLNVLSAPVSASVESIFVDGGVVVPGFLPDVYEYQVGINAGVDIPDIEYVLSGTADVSVSKATKIGEKTIITLSDGINEDKIYKFTFSERNAQGADAVVSTYKDDPDGNPLNDNITMVNAWTSGVTNSVFDWSAVRPYLYYNPGTSGHRDIIMRYDFTDAEYDIYGDFILHIYSASPNNEGVKINIRTLKTSDWQQTTATYDNTVNGNYDDEYVTTFEKGVAGHKYIDVSNLIRNKLAKGEKIITLYLAVDSTQTFTTTSNIQANLYGGAGKGDGAANWPSITYKTIMKSSDASLKELNITNGIPDKEFSPDVTEYEIAVSDANNIPQLDYKTLSSFATAEYTPATAIGETAVIKVTAQDGTEKTYSFKFVTFEQAGITENGQLSVLKSSFVSSGKDIFSFADIEKTKLEVKVRNNNIAKKSVILMTVSKNNGVFESVKDIKTIELETGNNTLYSEEITLPPDTTGYTLEGYVFDGATKLPLFDKAEVPKASFENTVFSASENLQYSINDSKVVFFGKVAPNTNIPFVLIAPDKNINDFTKDDYSSVVAIDMLKSGEDGMWEYQTEIPCSGKFYTAYISENGTLYDIPVLHTSINEKLGALSLVYNAVYDNSEEDTALAALKDALGLKNDSNINELVLGVDTSAISGLNEDNLIKLIYNFVKDAYETKPVVSDESDVNSFVELYNSALIIAKLNSGSVVVIPELISKLGFNDLTEIADKVKSGEMTLIESKLTGKGFEAKSDLYNEVKTQMLLSIINTAENPSITEDVVLTYGSFLGLDTTGYANLYNYQSDIITELANNGPYETRDLLSGSFSALITKYSRPPYTVINPPAPGGGGGGGGGSFKVPATGVENKFDTPTEELVPKLIKVFNDIEVDNWAYESTKYLADNGIISGVGNENFAPSNPVKREEFAKILCLAFNLEETDKEAEFSDVDKSAWYYPYVKTSFANSAMQGTDKNLFGIGKGLLRQDIAVVIARILELTEQDSQVFNDDFKISDYAKASVYALKKLGVIAGTGEGNFEPDRIVTRAECAKIVYEIVKEMK